jgi:hypothetical protein
MIVNNLQAEFASSVNKCQLFGTKDVITDEIVYDSLEICRKDEMKCGQNARFLEKEPFYK